MALLNVNPTRMEQTRLKKRLATSIRGHKLLKDKRDDLMKKFLDLIRRNKELREEIEQEISDIYGGFVAASAIMSPQMLEEALMLPKQSIDLEVGEHNIMSVTVPSSLPQRKILTATSIPTALSPPPVSWTTRSPLSKRSCPNFWSWHRLKKALR